MRKLPRAISTQGSSALTGRGHTGHPLGNYPNYYEFRRDEEGEDTRLVRMRAPWFKGKKVLDIGCNNGWLTLQIAFKFGCKHMVGVDIDNNLIEDAKKSLAGKLKHTPPPSPMYSPFNLSTLASQSSPSTRATTSTDPTSPIHTTQQPKVEFLAQDFIRSKSQNEKYDTITCFSVSKWIHLNYGDVGITTLFGKIAKLLDAGGRFIFEYQNWESYMMNFKDVSINTSNKMGTLSIKPQQFSTLLQKQYGFELEHSFHMDHAQTSFCRPLLVLIKK